MHLLWRYLKEYRKTLFLALFLASINQIFSLLDPQIFRLIIDNYATKVGDLPQEEFVRGVLVLLLAAMGVAFVSRVAANFQSYYLNVITQRVGAAMYGAGVAHSFSLPYFVFEDQRSGELLQKLQKARTDSQVFITSAVNIGFFSIVGILFVLAYAITIHWLIGLTYFLLIPILGTTAYLVGRRIRTAQKRIVAETAELAGSTTETLRNVELVKSLGLEAQETARLNKVNDRILGFELEKVKMVRKLMFLQGTTINALRSILMFVMLYLMFQGAMTLGQFFSLLFYSFFIFNPLGELGNLSSSYQEASASLEVLHEVLKTPPEPKPVSQKSPGTLRTVEFKKVSFAYASGTAPAVHGVTLSIRPGETIAFVGPSGSGKTTLVKLLVGLYRPTHGHLLINGIDAGSIDYESFRSRVGLVSQETQLFAGTIRENLLFVKPEASDEECMRALRMAAGAGILERARLLAPELQADPPDSLRESKRAGGGQAEQGLDTRIGEGGIKLSGGERQRLAISRALLRDPELIIFDEATSSLDSLTEREITKTIQDVEQANPTVMKVLVAHRLSTIAHAKRIYVLERGKIIEVGSHRELLKKKGLYAALWREQSSAG